MNTQPTERLVSCGVFSALAALNVQSAQAFLQLYQEAPAQSVEQQIHSLNVFWREQLGLAPVNTIEVREYLIDHCTLQDWLRMFALHVAPVVVQLGLPRQLPACPYPTF